jgi:membrane-associated HD superfamily phosphohydrolase
MINTDLELTALVFIFYLFECVHFLKPSEKAYTGLFTGKLKKWEYSPISYTLIGRHICVVNPLRVDDGVVIIRDKDFISGKAYPDRRTRAALRLSNRSISVLSILCSALAIILFVVLPVVVYRHLLFYLWKILLAEVLLLHITTCVVFTVELRRWEKDSTMRLSKALAVFFNPVAAIRCIDVLSQAVFDKLEKSTEERKGT